jgi:hypothetical protein
MVIFVKKILLEYDVLIQLKIQKLKYNAKNYSSTLEAIFKQFNVWNYQLESKSECECESKDQQKKLCSRAESIKREILTDLQIVALMKAGKTLNNISDEYTIPVSTLENILRQAGGKYKNLKKW